MSKPCCQRNSSPFKEEVGRGMGEKGQISSPPDYPIPTPTRPIANVAGSTFALKGRERVPRSGRCLAGSRLMRGLLVGSGVFGRRIGFVEEEARWLVGCLQHVEAAVARFSDRRFVVGTRCGNEGLDRLPPAWSSTSIDAPATCIDLPAACIGPCLGSNDPPARWIDPCRRYDVPS